jgi:hypothetical protein
MPKVTAAPQYSHEIIISPNLGLIGAPQLGHFRDATPEGATTGAAELDVGLGKFRFVLVPHFVQNAASSGSWVPHLWQYITGQRWLVKADALKFSLKNSC